MRSIAIRPLAVGVAAGAALAAGAFATVELATEQADAQGSGPATRAQLKSTDLRSQAALRLAKTINNKLGKHLLPNGTLIGATRPRGTIRQDRGTGRRGLPASTIASGAITAPKLRTGAVTTSKLRGGAVTAGKLGSSAVTGAKLGGGAVTGPKLADGAVSEDKLAAALAAKLPRWVAKVDNGANENDRASSSAFSAVRVGAGDYRADFGGTVISACSWTAVPSADSGLPAATEVQTALDTTDPTRVIIRTLDSTGALVESGWQAQVVC